MEQCCGHLPVKIVKGKQESTAISAPILPRERELSLAHAQKCNFLIMENCCGPLSLEKIPGNHCDFSTYFARERELSLAHVQKCSFLIMAQSCGPLSVEPIPRKPCDFST
jgi:hypothetical protein